MGRRLNSVKVAEELGRILIWDFGGRALEVRLVPHGTNAIAKTEEKLLSWDIVKELKPAPQVEGATVRDIQKLTEEWSLRAVTKADKVANPKKDLEKKQKALTTLETQIAARDWLKWRELGEWIKSHQTLEVPEEWVEWLDPTATVSENMTQAFVKARALEEKSIGTQERILRLKEEIADLQAGKPLPLKRKVKVFAEKAKVRRHDFSEQVTLFVGKSGVDNLMLLRKAQAWDVWVHLRDFPGAFGILHFPRHHKVSESERESAGQLVAAESAHRQLSPGDRFDVVFCECRHVRPIKGDKAGRVTFQNEAVRTYRLKP